MNQGLFTLILCVAFIGHKAAAQTTSTSTSPKEPTMKQFSLLVRVPETYGPVQAKAAGPLWGTLLENWKKEGVYVLSFAFPGESFTVSGSEKEIKKESVLSGDLRVVSNLVLQSESMEKVLELAKRVPVLPYGGKVEVREIQKPLPILK